MKRILCKLGLHDWRISVKVSSLGKDTDFTVSLKCGRCGREKIIPIDLDKVPPDCEHVETGKGVSYNPPLGEKPDNIHPSFWQ